MEIFISLDGVLRNTIQKFDYNYKCYYLDSDEVKKITPAGRLSKPKSTPKADTGSNFENETFDYKDEFEFNDEFEYKITTPINNDNLLNYYTFHSEKEFNNFLFIEFPVEIFAHAGVSYPTAFTDLNKLIYDNTDVNFTVVGLDELGKARPSSLFFLSKNGFLGNHIKFVKTSDIASEWANCDIWITDNKYILDNCPENKKAVKFETVYNENFTSELKINKLIEIQDLWLTSLENTTISI